MKVYVSDSAFALRRIKEEKREEGEVVVFHARSLLKDPSPFKEAAGSGGIFGVPPQICVEEGEIFFSAKKNFRLLVELAATLREKKRYGFCLVHEPPLKPLPLLKGKSSKKKVAEMEKEGLSVSILKFAEGRELLRKWIKRFCEELETKLTAEAEKYLLANFEDPGDVYQLLKLLSLSKTGVKVIGEEDVKGLRNITITPFSYYDRLKKGEGNPAADLKYLLYREEPLSVLGALGYKILQEWHLSKDPKWESVVLKLHEVDKELKSTGKSPFLLLYSLVREVVKRRVLN